MVAEVELGILADVAPLPVTDSVLGTLVGVVVLVAVPVAVVIAPGAAVVTPVVVVMRGLQCLRTSCPNSDPASR
jgi:hypothetical protein